LAAIAHTSGKAANELWMDCLKLHATHMIMYWKFQSISSWADYDDDPIMPVHEKCMYA
jgi:hypothetical protein